MLDLLRSGIPVIGEGRCVVKIDDQLSFEFAISILSTGVIVKPPKPKQIVAILSEQGGPDDQTVLVIERNVIDIPGGVTG